MNQHCLLKLLKMYQDLKSFTKSLHNKLPYVDKAKALWTIISSVFPGFHFISQGFQTKSQMMRLMNTSVLLPLIQKPHQHAVYGLRYYFRLIGQNKRAIDLPSLKGDTRLPVIFNRAELRELFIAPTL